MRRVFQFTALVILLIGIFFFAYRKYTKSFSPLSSVNYSNNDLNVNVKYSQPAKKGRHIFGRIQDNALVPYDKVWRTGANEATVIEFDKPVLFAGQKVAAGKYSIWSIPGQSQWQIILNSDTGQWGTEYNDGKNILKSTVGIRIKPQIQELFKIYFEEFPRGTNLILSWDQTEAIVPIQFL